MKRGEIFFANLDPTLGAEIKKCRPVLIISNDVNNRIAKTVTVIPLTSNTKKVYPFEVYLAEKDSGLSKASKLQCHQIRTISKLRIKDSRPCGRIGEGLMLRVQAALALHLAWQ